MSSRENLAVVYEEERFLAFLDHRPLFPGHALLIPKLHFGTLLDLPPDWAPGLISAAQLLCAAMEQALGAEGTFVAMNNRVSQSVPHLHVHIVPRRKGDGLRGFFWPRQKYPDPQALETVRAALQSAVIRSKPSNSA